MTDRIASLRHRAPSVRAWLALLGGLAACVTARADLGNGWGPSPAEIAQLPPYCQAYFVNKVLPPNCDGVHHLCAGRVLMNRAMNISIPKPERQRIVRLARTEVEYMFGRPNAACTFMGEARATQQQLPILEALVR